MYSGLSTNQAV